MEELAIRCTPQGEMEARPDVLEMLNSDFDYHLLGIKDSMMRCRAIIERAKVCRHNKDERAALHYCQQVVSIARCDKFLRDYGKEAESIIREVDGMLCSLSSSDDEYVWEAASQAHDGFQR